MQTNHVLLSLEWMLEVLVMDDLTTNREHLPLSGSCQNRMAAFYYGHLIEAILILSVLCLVEEDGLTGGMGWG